MHLIDMTKGFSSMSRNRNMLSFIHSQVEEFVDMLKRNESFYGLQDDTINSLLLSVLPISNYTFNKDISMPSFTSSSSVLTRIIQAVQFMLQHSIGFQIMSVSNLNRFAVCFWLLCPQRVV